MQEEKSDGKPSTKESNANLDNSGTPINNYVQLEKGNSAVTQKATRSRFFTKRSHLTLSPNHKIIDFHFSLIELFLLFACSCISWKRLKAKKNLLHKAKEKLFFQLDVLNYLKKMQLLDLLVYSLLEPEENIILQFLSKPSISLAQRNDIFDKINQINNVDSKEVNELYSAIKKIEQKTKKTKIQERLYYLSKTEMGMWIRRVQDL